MMASTSKARASRALPVAVLPLLFLLLPACMAFLQLQPKAPLARSHSSARPEGGRARGTVVCKKASSGGVGGGGGGAAKGFGFGTKKDPKVDKYKYSGRLRPGELGSTRLVPADIIQPDYALDGWVVGFGDRMGPWIRMILSQPQLIFDRLPLPTGVSLRVCVCVQEA